MVAEFEQLEQLVAKIQRQLAPNAQVIHNAKVTGRRTGVTRQVDVLVRDRIGQYEIMIAIECKDHNSPIDVKGVEEFEGLLSDVGAQKGVLVCPKGFTSTAKVLAEKLQIELYSPVDTDPHKWQAKATVPAICDFRGALISFGLSTSAPIPFMIAHDFFSTATVYDGEGRDLGTMVAAAAEKWNEGKWPIEPGEHQELPLFDVPVTHMDNGYEPAIRCAVKLGASIEVSRDLYFGEFDVTRISGFADHIRGGVIANAFTVGILDPDEVMEKWQKLAKVEDAPMRPVLSIQALLGWVV